VADVDGISWRTAAYWQTGSAPSPFPFEWQEAVIRAAITLKLNVFEDTGAIIAALTTLDSRSAGERAQLGLSLLLLRDAYFVINALNRLSDTQTMERYLSYISTSSPTGTPGTWQPAYGIHRHSVTDEREVDSLPGYRGQGAGADRQSGVQQVQHDVYARHPRRHGMCSSIAGS